MSAESESARKAVPVGITESKALLRTLEVRTFRVLSLVSGISRRKWILPIMFSEDFHPRMRLRYPKELKGRARRLNA